MENIYLFYDRILPNYIGIDTGFFQLSNKPTDVQELLICTRIREENVKIQRTFLYQSSKELVHVCIISSSTREEVESALYRACILEIGQSSKVS